MGYVYKITNTVNQKSYIGISIYEPEKRRIRDHLTGRGNRILANAIKKYGRDAFIYEILEKDVFPEILPDLEVAYIAKFKTVRPLGYNLTTGGEIAKSLSEETCRKISESNTGKKRSIETRQKMSDARKSEKNPNYGKPAWNRGEPLSTEHRKKISEAKKGIPRSKETREKLRIANLGKRYSKEARENMGRARLGRVPWNKGKKLSAVHRQKVSAALRGEKHPNRSSHYEVAHQFFSSLPSDMDLKQKRRLLLDKFSDVLHHSTIYSWIQKWNSGSYS